VLRYPVTASLLGNDISAGVASYLRAAGEYDVMHAHSHLYFSTNLAALARAASGSPLAITNHGLYSQNAPEWLFDLYLRSVGRWTFERADVVFCYTEEDRERVREFGVGSRIEVVSNGIDTERFRPKGPESELVDAAGPVVLFVGRLVEGKRPGDAVRAVAQLRETRPDAELYLCGEGPMREELADLAGELGIEGAVHFLGHLAYDEMPDVYRAGDALVLPSRVEGMPRTVIEAMASGVPVVTSDLEQVAPVVERAGVARCQSGTLRDLQPGSDRCSTATTATRGEWPQRDSTGERPWSGRRQSFRNCRRSHGRPPPTRQEPTPTGTVVVRHARDSEGCPTNLTQPVSHADTCRGKRPARTPTRRWQRCVTSTRVAGAFSPNTRAWGT
jgi:hypothetical protein